MRLAATTSAVRGAAGKLLVDEPDETWTEPFAARQQPNDNIFDASENAIQLSGGDYSSLGNPGRTASLMPFNFVSNARAALIRQRFTSTSWDLKSFGKEFFGPDTTGGVGPYDARRLWEFTDTSTASAPVPVPSGFRRTLWATPRQPRRRTFAALHDNLRRTPDADRRPRLIDGESRQSAERRAQYVLRIPCATAVSSSACCRCLANPNLSSNPATGRLTDLGALPQTNLIQPQRLLSVNGLTEMYQNGTDSNDNPIYNSVSGR